MESTTKKRKTKQLTWLWLVRSCLCRSWRIVCLFYCSQSLETCWQRILDRTVRPVFPTAQLLTHVWMAAFWTQSIDNNNKNNMNKSFKTESILKNTYRRLFLFYGKEWNDAGWVADDNFLQLFVRARHQSHAFMAQCAHLTIVDTIQLQLQHFFSKCFSLFFLFDSN